MVVVLDWTLIAICLVALTIVLVVLDVKKIERQNDDMGGVLPWALGLVLMWIFVFPYYIVKRDKTREDATQVFLSAEVAWLTYIITLGVLALALFSNGYLGSGVTGFGRSSVQEEFQIEVDAAIAEVERDAPERQRLEEEADRAARTVDEAELAATDVERAADDAANAASPGGESVLSPNTEVGSMSTPESGKAQPTPAAAEAREDNATTDDGTGSKTPIIHAAEPPAVAAERTVVRVPPSTHRKGARITLVEYPSASRRRGEQGEVSLEVYVLETGRPGEVKVAKSSGFPKLDEAAVKEVETNWRFAAGREDGVPTAMWHTFSVTFSLDD